MDNLFDFRDTEINAEEIMARIRERIAVRRTKAAAQGLDYDKLAAGQELELPAASRQYVTQGTSAALSAATQVVARARQVADNIFVPVSIVGHEPPVIGGIVRRARSMAHRLVVYYTNMLAGRQAAVNRAQGDALSSLLVALEDGYTRIDALQVEVARLRGELDSQRDT